MTINLNPKRSAINTGFNLLGNEKVSPSLNTLVGPSIADVAPNEEQVMSDVASTEIGGAPEQAAPLVSEVPETVESTPVQSENEIPQGLSTGETLENSGPKQVTVEASTPEEADDPFADAILPSMLTDGFDTEAAFNDALSGKQASRVTRSEERTGWDYAKDAMIASLGPVASLAAHLSTDENRAQFKEEANKLAYGGVKGIAGTLDLVTAPGWAAGHLIANGQKFPFTTLLEEFYPEKAYQFEEDPDSFGDELMRMSQTGMEFLVGGGIINAAAKGVPAAVGSMATRAETMIAQRADKSLSSGAYDVSMADELWISGLAATGYQGAKELGANDAVAMLASFIAPSSPELIKAFYKVSTKGAVEAGVKPTMFALSKIAEYLPVTSLVKTAVKTSGHDYLQTKKHQLMADEKMWSGSIYSRKAREIVLKTPDRKRSLEEQTKEIQSIQRWVAQAFPDTPEMREHLDRMRLLQDNINAELPEDQKIAFTLEQLYTPVLKKQGAEAGIKEVMESIRLVNGDAYDAQLMQNQKAMTSYIMLKKDKLGPEETRAFTDLFDTHLDQVTQMQESIYHLSANDKFINQVNNVGYEYAHEPVAAELVPALKEIRGLLGTAYDSMLERLPKDVELDTTPVKDAVLEIYESLGVFSDPKSIPPYLKAIVKAMVKSVETDEAASAYTALKNEASTVGIELNKINRELRETAQAHKKAISEFDEKDTKGLAALKLQQDEAMLQIQGRHSELLQRQKQLDIEKRSTKQSVAGDIEALPEPNLVNVGDIQEGLKNVNKKMREAFDRGDFDQYEVLGKLHQGLSDSLAGLKEVDPEAHRLFEVTNSHYKNFVSTDFNESMAYASVEKGNHLLKLTSPKAAKMLWEDADSEDIQRFLRNFDGTREGLANYMDNILTPEADDVKAIDVYSKEAERGVQALRDLVFTTLSRQINKIDMDPEIDPAKRMEKIKQLLIEFTDKHKPKLEQIPGLEGLADDATVTIGKLAKYRQALEVLEERKKLGILKDVVGPGVTAKRIMNDTTTANQMYEFLTNKLASVELEGTGSLQVAQAEANAIRKSLRQGILNEYTKNGVIDHKGLDRVLATGTSTRNNLSLVLGEQEVLKLDAMRYLGTAMANGKTDFTAVLTSDSTLRNLENLGLPLGRIGSLLQRRAVFTPSGGYIAGAIASKVLNSMGNKNTSRAMQLLVDRPFDVLNLDQILLREMRDLPPHKANSLKSVMEGSQRHMRELAAWLPKQMAKHVQAHMAYLGYEASQSEVVQMIEEVLYEDPRHPEFNKVEPTEDRQ